MLLNGGQYTDIFMLDIPPTSYSYKKLIPRMRLRHAGRWSGVDKYCSPMEALMRGEFVRYFLGILLETLKILTRILMEGELHFGKKWNTSQLT